MNNEALPIFKVLADETRLKILRALDEKESYVELLAERLSLTPATVSFHMKKLLAAGLVDARREQYYTIYSIRREFFRATLQSLIFQSDGGETAEELREELTAGGFSENAVHGVVGAAWLAPELDTLLTDPTAREALLRTARLLDRREDISGLSTHLLCISEK